MAVNFKVSRYETVARRCDKCGGVGHTIKKNANGTFKTNCPHCIEGRYTYEHKTEVSLLEALKELGLIK